MIHLPGLFDEAEKNLKKGKGNLFSSVRNSSFHD